MDTKQIQTVEEIIDYKFKNKQFLIQAHTRRSFSEENYGELNNEVLETVGDAVLSLCALQGFLKEYAKETPQGLSVKKNEKEFTELRSKLVRKQSLAGGALQLNLANPEHMRLGRGDMSQKVYNEPSVQEDLLESIVGAVAVDCGFDNKTMYEVASRLLDLEKHIAAGFEETPQNYIGELQEYCQKRGIEKPNYQYGTEIDGQWICRLAFDDEVFKNYGRNQKEARNTVARMVLAAIKDKPIDEVEPLYDIGRDNQNAINFLQELWQAGQIPQPTIYKEGGSECNWQFSATIPPLGLSAVATATTKKEAKIQAARKLYELVKKLKNLR
ncbi:MAG: hypothetical protein LBT20_06910 [Clostridiales bacterium]|jgi:dsRNA-specific ribonuclease|nr:hypothetical protein [Clostridiales bacterium]